MVRAHWCALLFKRLSVHPLMKDGRNIEVSLRVERANTSSRYVPTSSFHHQKVMTSVVTLISPDNIK